VHARRALLPLALLVAYVYIQCASTEGWRALSVETVLPSARDLHIDTISTVMPSVHETLTVAAPPRTLEELKQRIAAVLQRQNMAGTGIALVGRDGPIWVGGIGVRDRASGAPMDGDSAFRVGSLSKTIVALGVMRLVDQGKLDIDRPLREILPGVVDNPWEEVAPVTLAQLMEHTAGIDDIRFNEIFTDDETASVADVLAINPRSKRTRWRPGTRHAYSNIGYTIAARAIEVATGEPFDVYLKREVLAPMGIVDADFKRTDLLRSRLVTGYMEQQRPAPFRTFAHRPSAALLISASDLGKLVQFFIRRGEGYPPIVSKAGLDRIEHSRTTPYPHLDSEYGFAIYGDVNHPLFARGHDGGMPGFHASIRYFPELGTGYVMLLNNNYAFQGYGEIRSLLYAYLARNHEAPHAPTVAAAIERPAADFYGLAAPHNEIFGFMEVAQTGWRVWNTDTGIKMAMMDGGWAGRLVPTADGGYRFPGQVGSFLRFSTSVEDGKPVMVMGFTYGEARHGFTTELRFYAVRLAFVLATLATPWAIVTLLLAVLRRRRTLPTSLVVWPALAGLSCYMMSHLLELAFYEGVVGMVHPLTIAVCAVTMLLGIASTASFVSALRWAIRPDRPPWLPRLFPTLCGVALFGMTLWFAAHHLIGFRTWAW